MNQGQAVDRDFYRTSDMGLVSYLRMSGYDPQACNWDVNTCYWLFRTTPAVLELIDKYNGGEATVEPKEFNRQYGFTKDEFHDSKHR